MERSVILTRGIIDAEFEGVPPQAVRCLRFLVERGQVELLSALYTPTLWVAFPRHDLVKSIERNQRCLKELGLPWNRVFFAQEAFFGEAVNTLAEYFDVAICKDDYVSYFYDFDYSNPCLQIGDIKVVVASGHILYEALCEARRSPECTANARLTERHRLHIQEACELNDGRNFPAIFGTWRNLEWLWYHCGDGNHFSAIFKPQDLERAYHDRSWERWCEHLMDNIQRRGYRLATIDEFVSALDYSEARQLPLLIEGSWNAKRSRGVYTWMGDYATPSGNDSAVLTGVCRARERLLLCEKVVQSMAGTADAGTTEAARRRGGLRRILGGHISKAILDHSPVLGEAWDHVFQAEVSDSLGWLPTYEGVMSSLEHGDKALSMATELLAHLERAAGWEIEDDVDVGESGHDVGPAEWPQMELFGVNGGLATDRVSPLHVVCEACFEVAAPRFGIRLPFDADSLVFCPSGIECVPVSVKLDVLKPDVITLPLANGLIKIADGTFLVKDVRFVHIAARISKNQRTLEYTVENGPIGRHFTWRFHLVRCGLENAVRFANELNAAACIRCGGPTVVCDARDRMKRRLDLVLPKVSASSTD